MPARHRFRKNTYHCKRQYRISSSPHRQEVSRYNSLRRSVLLLPGIFSVQPIRKRHILTYAAKQRHRGMCMRVAEGRHQYSAAAIVFPDASFAVFTYIIDFTATDTNTQLCHPTQAAIHYIAVRKQYIAHFNHRIQYITCCNNFQQR